MLNSKLHLAVAFGESMHIPPQHLVATATARKQQHRAANESMHAAADAALHAGRGRPLSQAGRPAAGRPLTRCWVLRVLRWVLRRARDGDERGDQEEREHLL